MNAPQRFWSMVTGVLVLLMLFLAVISIKVMRETGYVGRGADSTATINVDGTGDVVAVPDVATFSFTVTETAKDVATAQSTATTKLNAALKAVRDQGVADKDISTESYAINPHYEYQNAVCPALPVVNGTMSRTDVVYCPSGKNVLTGYDVSETIQVKVRDLTKAGAIFTSIGSLGVQNVNGLTFSVDEPDAIQAQARAKAIADAKAKADALADQLGTHIVRVVSFSDNNGAYPRPIMYAMDKAVSVGAAAPAVPEVPTGEQKVTDNVTITYEIR